ncbi:MAG: DNA cytosine methyltransferase [Alteromonadaceae bacterium]|uniref:DNA cytosine methyltransferase n=1 Tax=Marinobacter sp. TaxID=50741 RepID=UPI0029C18D84|nr:DNA cytosine methyltransferase [Marinobacter sp.]MDX5388399.1 DNA cytosine methyltransferase [Marinobacter sp.]MDX5441038.1 DNA cytosine methyltransferase [Alteromonadaceae bacterium]
MTDTIKVIDLFAGPGGLGEGFSAFKTPDGTHPFKIVASVEKEASAHKTLTLRAFYRQFLGRGIPPQYYEYLRSSHKVSAEQFFSEKFPKEWAAAKRETLGGPKALGSKDHDEIFRAIEEQIADHKGKKIVIGGPPCQAYSLVGRARNKGIKGYVAEEDHRHFLYKEYLKVLDLVQPDIFVMENVKGILTAKVNGESIFEKIREDLACPARAINSDREAIEYVLLPFAHPLEDRNLIGGFKNKDFVIRAEEFGVPQARHRVILLGVRKGLVPKELTGELLSNWRQDKQVTAGEILANLPPLRSGLSRAQPNDFQTWKNNFEKAFLKVYMELAFSTKAQDNAKSAYDSTTEELNQGGRFVPLKQRSNNRLPEHLQRWYEDEHLLGFVNHEARNHMAEDLHRYLYASCYAAAKGGISPRSRDYPESLTPNHKNWKSGNFTDRFKVQAQDRVASTVTSHISKDGHYFIHYDPSQCRSLTVREAARIQTFPDNYFFEGNRTEQYVQVGNAVPPLLANHIAKVVFDLLKIQN